MLKTRWEFKLQTCVLFLDYTKAYDKDNRKKLWTTLENYNIPQSLVNGIKSMYRCDTKELTSIKGCDKSVH